MSKKVFATTALISSLLSGGIIESSQASATESRFAGTWINSQGVSYRDVIVLNQEGRQLSGTIDCLGHKADRAELKGTVEGNVAILEMTSEDMASGDEKKGQARIEIKDSKLRWKITKEPDGENYLSSEESFTKARPNQKFYSAYDEVDPRGPVSFALYENGNLSFSDDIDAKEMRYCLKKIKSGRYSLTRQSEQEKPSTDTILVLQGKRFTSESKDLSGELINRSASTDKPVNGTIDGKSYEMKLVKTELGAECRISDGEQEQTVVSLEESKDAKDVKLVWVGDLDGDKRLDYVIDVGIHGGWNFPECAALLLTSELGEVAGTASVAQRVDGKN